MEPSSLSFVSVPMSALVMPHPAGSAHPPPWPSVWPAEGLLWDFGEPGRPLEGQASRVPPASVLGLYLPGSHGYHPICLLGL